MLGLTDQAFFHGVGRHDKVVPMAPAVVAAAGTDGLIVEVHHDPDRFRLLMNHLRIIAPFVRRTI